MIGCSCATCTSDDPRNKRLRSSILIEGECRIVVDTSIDFRQQMLREEVPRLDGVVFTHHHADHVLGLDDVFPFTARSKQPLPLYARPETLAELKLTFRHLFSTHACRGIAQLQPHEIDGPFQMGDLLFQPIEVLHGRMPIFGYRIGPFAYLTDVSEVPEGSRDLLRDLECLVVDGLRFRPHPTHFSIPEAIALADELAPRRTYLIHMTHDVEHAQLSAQLPKSIFLAYDGLTLEFP